MGKSPLAIHIVCPAKPGTRFGNRVTSLRWQRILRDLGHRVRIVDSQPKQSTAATKAKASNCDLLLALHAHRSSDAIERFSREQPGRPIILGIAGTDLYRDTNTKETKRSLRLADRIVTLQPAAIKDLPAAHRKKSRAIYQSVIPTKVTRPRRHGTRNVVVAAHLRRLKDPFRTAMAIRDLPSESRIFVEQYGRVIETPLRAKAASEDKKNSRYRWLGEIPRGQLRRRLASCWLTVISSKFEGGANVVSESIVDHTVVLASRVAGNLGLLGETYDGYFEVGATRQLRDLLLRCEQEPTFHASLRKQVAARAPLFRPVAEKAAWKKLISELT